MARHLPNPLRGDEPGRLIAAARCTRDRLLILCGLYLGLRVSELVGRRVDDLDLDAGVCMVRHGKGDKDRAVPIPSLLRPELLTWLAGRRDGWLFPGRGATGHLSVRAAQLLVQGAAKRAGIVRRVTPHKMRHAFAVSLLRAGADIMEVRDLMGHASIATTQIYLWADPERMRAAVDRLHFGGLTPPEPPGTIPA